jgi:hypothetical protein
MPPARELSLWMRRRARERGLLEPALYLTVREVAEATPDRRGRWLIVRCDHTPEWLGDSRPSVFSFKARPGTPWPILAEAT